MNADLAHDPDLAHPVDLGTWDDRTQSAYCPRCHQRVASLEWVDGPCSPKKESL